MPDFILHFGLAQAVNQLQLLPLDPRRLAKRFSQGEKVVDLLCTSGQHDRLVVGMPDAALDVGVWVPPPHRPLQLRQRGASERAGVNAKRLSLNRRLNDIGNST